MASCQLSAMFDIIIAVSNVRYNYKIELSIPHILTLKTSNVIAHSFVCFLCYSVSTDQDICWCLYPQVYVFTTNCGWYYSCRASTWWRNGKVHHNQSGGQVLWTGGAREGGQVTVWHRSWVPLFFPVCCFLSFIFNGKYRNKLKPLLVHKI